MALSDEEYERICQLLGREPTYVELGMFAVMWSEHCGYKNSRPVLRQFPTRAPWVLQGPGENAGVVDIGDGLAVAFKMESHNHPSAVEPFQGAATGVGGIVRDIFAMGARPIALLDSLRFGELASPRNRYLFSGVVAGIAWYGNCIGVPTVGGEVYFDESYSGNPLVNVMCVGLLPREHLQRGAAAGPGNAVMLVGARTGRDGIHGATFASEELSEASEQRRPSVQVGDPFKEKLLIEACLELVQRDLLVGIQDLGAAGITGATSETAGRAGTGMELDLDRVLLRETGMTPYEIMISESQERMLVVPRPGREAEVRAVLEKWGLEASVIGRVTNDGILRVRHRGETVAEVPVSALIDECPVYYPPSRVPDYLVELWEREAGPVPEPRDYREVFARLLSRPTIASKQWVYRQYDHMVQINTVVPPGLGAAVLRVKGTCKGLALTTDGNGRYCYLDPYRGGAIAVAEAARNAACVGARPLAITDCLNFGNPQKPEVFWQFTQAVTGMAEACRILGIPVVSGNVSFYNESKADGTAVYPTPVVGLVGLLEDVERRVVPGWRMEGEVVALVGPPAGELNASEYLWVCHRRLGLSAPQVDLELESRLVRFLLEAAASGLLSSAHDCSEGGLAVTLAECCLAAGLGAAVDLAPDDRPDVLLFGESQGRVVISFPEEKRQRVEELAASLNLPLAVLGRTGGAGLEVRIGGRTCLGVSVDEMERWWRGGLVRALTA
ncbi:MAG: phosphoribosylformylglycinamidine synthase subunit PurL [Clostridia bacterium]|jgi:phosphoribosylformylglycinamidine synthase|nr:phosphoribosylformylglycinamidine synthase subunit PurL [Clostridia bacterium]MDH7573651.1 phosphoribosylformylglycinamidine synthase subunit PurL [Clostridia bacterium]